MKRKKRKALIAVLCVGIIISAAVIIDWMNIPSKMGIVSAQFNYDFWSIMIGGLVPIGLFVVTYILIDSYQNEKEKNKIGVAMALIKQAYDTVSTFAGLYIREDVRRVAVQKCDFNKSIIDDPTFQNLQNIPFESNDTIIQFVSEGVIEKSIFQDYLDVKKQYEIFVTTAILFFELTDQINTEYVKLCDMIKKAHNILEENSK